MNFPTYHPFHRAALAAQKRKESASPIPEEFSLSTMDEFPPYEQLVLRARKGPATRKRKESNTPKRKASTTRKGKEPATPEREELAPVHLLSRVRCQPLSRERSLSPPLPLHPSANNAKTLSSASHQMEMNQPHTTSTKLNQLHPMKMYQRLGLIHRQRSVKSNRPLSISL